MFIFKIWRGASAPLLPISTALKTNMWENLLAIAKLSRATMVEPARYLAEQGLTQGLTCYQNWHRFVNKGFFISPFFRETIWEKKIRNLQFIFSKKTKKMKKSSPSFWHYVSSVKSMVKISSIFVAFLVLRKQGL